MTLDRIEATGAAGALLGHAALMGALYWLGNAGPDDQPVPPPAPPMQVSFVDDVGLVSAAPTMEPAASSFAPELGETEEAAPPATDVPVPAPEPAPTPPPRPDPAPAQKAEPVRRPAATQPQTPARQQERPARQPATGTAQASRGSRIGPDLLKGIGNDPVSRNQQPSGATVSDQARASMDALIIRALIPCQRQPVPAPEASAIKVRVEVTLNREGGVASARVLSVANDDPDLRIYEARMRDLALNVVRQCAPIRGLPAEYYDVPRGWRQFRYVFPRD